QGHRRTPVHVTTIAKFRCSFSAAITSLEHAEAFICCYSASSPVSSTEFIRANVGSFACGHRIAVEISDKVCSLARIHRRTAGCEMEVGLGKIHKFRIGNLFPASERHADGVRLASIHAEIDIG